MTDYVQLVAAAAQAAGPSLEGQESAWQTRVRARPRYWWARLFNCRVLVRPALELLLTVTSGRDGAHVRGIRLESP